MLFNGGGFPVSNGNQQQWRPIHDFVQEAGWPGSMITPGVGDATWGGGLQGLYLEYQYFSGGSWGAWTRTLNPFLSEDDTPPCRYRWRHPVPWSQRFRVDWEQRDYRPIDGSGIDVPGAAPNVVVGCVVPDTYKYTPFRTVGFPSATNPLFDGRVSALPWRMTPESKSRVLTGRVGGSGVQDFTATITASAVELVGVSLRNLSSLNQAGYTVTVAPPVSGDGQQFPLKFAHGFGGATVTGASGVGYYHVDPATGANIMDGVALTSGGADVITKETYLSYDSTSGNLNIGEVMFSGGHLTGIEITDSDEEPATESGALWAAVGSDWVHATSSSSGYLVGKCTVSGSAVESSKSYEWGGTIPSGYHPGDVDTWPTSDPYNLTPGSGFRFAVLTLPIVTVLPL